MMKPISIKGSERPSGLSLHGLAVAQERYDKASQEYESLMDMKEKNDGEPLGPLLDIRFDWNYGGAVPGHKELVEAVKAAIIRDMERLMGVAIKDLHKAEMAAREAINNSLEPL